MSHLLATVGCSMQLFCVLALPSCIDMSGITRSKFESLTPGMTIAQVGETVGAPERTVGEITTAYGQDVVIWQYEKFSSPGMRDDIYWVYLVEGQFLKYTRQGNWQLEKDIVYHTEFSLPLPEKE